MSVNRDPLSSPSGPRALQHRALEQEARGLGLSLSFAPTVPSGNDPFQAQALGHCFVLDQGHNHFKVFFQQAQGAYYSDMDGVDSLFNFVLKVKEAQVLAAEFDDGCFLPPRVVPQSKEDLEGHPFRVSIDLIHSRTKLYLYHPKRHQIVYWESKDTPSIAMQTLMDIHQRFQDWMQASEKLNSVENIHVVSGDTRVTSHHFHSYAETIVQSRPDYHAFRIHIRDPGSPSLIHTLEIQDVAEIPKAAAKAMATIHTIHSLDLDWDALALTADETLNIYESPPEYPAIQDSILSHFDKINWTDSNAPSYVNPTTLKADDRFISRHDLRQKLGVLAKSIEDKRGLLGWNEANQVPYERLNALMCHVLAALEKANDPGLTATIVLIIAEVGGLCGPRCMERVRHAFNLLGGNLSGDAEPIQGLIDSYKVRVCEGIARELWHICEPDSQNAMDVHFLNYIEVCLRDSNIGYPGAHNPDIFIENWGENFKEINYDPEGVCARFEQAMKSLLLINFYQDLIQGIQIQPYFGERVQSGLRNYFRSQVGDQIEAIQDTHRDDLQSLELELEKAENALSTAFSQLKRREDLEAAYKERARTELYGDETSDQHWEKLPEFRRYAALRERRHVALERLSQKRHAVVREEDMLVDTQMLKRNWYEQEWDEAGKQTVRIDEVAHIPILLGLHYLNPRSPQRILGESLGRIEYHPQPSLELLQDKPLGHCLLSLKGFDYLLSFLDHEGTFAQRVVKASLINIEAAQKTIQKQITDHIAQELGQSHGVKVEVIWGFPGERARLESIHTDPQRLSVMILPSVDGRQFQMGLRDSINKYRSLPMVPFKPEILSECLTTICIWSKGKTQNFETRRAFAMQMMKKVYRRLPDNSTSISSTAEAPTLSNFEGKREPFYIIQGDRDYTKFRVYYQEKGEIKYRDSNALYDLSECLPTSGKRQREEF